MIPGPERITTVIEEEIMVFPVNLSRQQVIKAVLCFLGMACGAFRRNICVVWKRGGANTHLTVAWTNLERENGFKRVGAYGSLADRPCRIWASR